MAVKKSISQNNILIEVGEVPYVIAFGYFKYNSLIKKPNIQNKKITKDCSHAGLSFGSAPRYTNTVHIKMPIKNNIRSLSRVIDFMNIITQPVILLFSA